MYIQKIIPSPNKDIELYINNFSGGMNNASEQLLDNESRDILNMFFVDEVLMEKRLGQTYYDALTLEHASKVTPITFVDEFKPYKDNDMLVRASDYEIYFDNKLVSTVAGRVCGVNYNGKYLFVDGSNLYVYGKFPRSVSTHVGITGVAKLSDIGLTSATTPYVNTPIVITGVAKSDTSGIKYLNNNLIFDLNGTLITLGDASYANIGAIVASIQAQLTADENTDVVVTESSNKIVITGGTDIDVIIGAEQDAYVLMKVVSPTAGFVPLASPNVVGVTRYNYTTGNVCYEPCQYEVEDTSKGANEVPTTSTILLHHDGRLFSTGVVDDNDNVFISDSGNAYYFPATLPIQMPPNSDRVVGFCEFNDGVVVGRNNDIHVIVGKTNNPSLGLELFTCKKLNTHTGFAGRNCFANINSYLFYLGNDGVVYALSSINYESQNLITTIVSKQLDLFKAPINLTNDMLSNACAITNNNCFYLSFGNVVMIYSYLNRAWTRFNNLYATSFYNKQNVLLWGRTDGTIAKFGTNYLDFIFPYQCYIYSKRYDMGIPSVYKYFKEFYIVAHAYDDYLSDIFVDFEIDYSDVTNHIAIKSQISIWGIARFGDVFINKNINESSPIMIIRRGRNISFKLRNGYFITDTLSTVDDLNTYVDKSEGVLVRIEADNLYYLYTNGDWKLMEDKDLNQRMKVYQINGTYELRDKR